MRWSRRSATEAAEAVDPAADADDAATEEGPDPRADGPWDASERAADDEEQRIDLGSVSVPARTDVQVQVQVDEASGEVSSVLLVAEDGAMELRAYAAPRNEDIWDDLRMQLAAEAKRRGGDSRRIALGSEHGPGRSGRTTPRGRFRMWLRLRVFGPTTSASSRTWQPGALGHRHVMPLARLRREP